METKILSNFIRTEYQDDGYQLYTKASTEPFAICFVYPKGAEPVAVKGMLNIVEKYVKENFPVCLYHLTCWKDGRQRGHWRFQGITAYVQHITDKRVFEIPNHYPDYFKRGFNVTIYGPKPEQKLLAHYHFRRMPKTWLSKYEVQS